MDGAESIGTSQDYGTKARCASASFARVYSRGIWPTISSHRGDLSNRRMLGSYGEGRASQASLTLVTRPQTTHSLCGNLSHCATEGFSRCCRRCQQLRERQRQKQFGQRWHGSLYDHLRLRGFEVLDTSPLFLRYRNTYLRNVAHCLPGLLKYFLGHADRDMSDRYDKVGEGANAEFRSIKGERDGCGIQTT